MQRSFPVVQRKRWVWIWMGDASKADEQLIPDTFSVADPGWRWKPGYMHYGAHYLNIADNLLDFSHLSHVHEKTFGGSPNVAEARPEVTQLERGMRVSRPVRDTVPAPYHRRLGRFTGKVNRWFNHDFLIPGVLLLDAGVRPVEDAEDDNTRALRFHSCQAITPETERSTHYFFMQAHGFALDDAVVTDSIEQSQRSAFAEDKLILEAQQLMIDSTPASPMVNIVADMALMQYRRLIDKLLAAEAHAQDFPPRQITIVVPFPAGEVTDQLARGTGQQLAENLKVTVIVDNKPGGSAQIAAAAVKQAPADGATIVMGDIGAFALNPSLFTKLSYDIQKDFVPLARLVLAPSFLVAPASSPFNSMGDLVAAARTRPVSIASQSNGSGGYLFAEMLMRQAGVKRTHVPCRGSAPALNNLFGGQVESLFDPVITIGPFVKDGKLKALALGGDARRPCFRRCQP